ncbi:MAG: hypothetical protein H7836_06980, partial [Magnetococcus sp. YQC-3]
HRNALAKTPPSKAVFFVGKILQHFQQLRRTPSDTRTPYAAPVSPTFGFFHPHFGPPFSVSRQTFGHIQK